MKFLMLICLLSGILFISPQLKFEQFNLLDIAESISIDYSDILSDATRFRPLFYINRVILKSILPDVHFYFLFSGILSGLILFISVRILRTFHVIKPPGLLFLWSMYFISPIMVDSFWRLGTAENLLTLMLVLGLDFLLRKKYFASFVSMIGLLLSKETALFFMPVYAGMCWVVKKEILTVMSLLVVAVIIPFFFAVPLEYAMNPGNYTSLFTYSPINMIRIAGEYIKSFPQLFILGGMSILLYMVNRRRKNILNRTLLAVMMITSFISLLFFDNIQAYYLLPLHVLTSICLVNEILTLKNTATRVVVTILAISIILSNVESIGRVMYFWQVDYAVDGPLVTFLLNPPAGLYQIGEGHREDHTYAIKLLLGDQVIRNTVMADYMITRYDYIPDGFELYRHFCSDTLFQEKVCRWYILKKR